MVDLKRCKIVSGEKICLAQHSEQTFLTADLAIDSLSSSHFMPEKAWIKRENQMQRKKFGMADYLWKEKGL